MTARSFLTLILSCSLPVFSFAAQPTREPKTDLKQALAKAEHYVADKKLDVSALFLSSINRSEFPKKPKQNGWVVIWASKSPVVRDGELRVYVYDDGRMDYGGAS